MINPVLEIRFGYGVRPGAPPATVASYLSGLRRADPLAQSFPRPSLQHRIDFYLGLQSARADERNNKRGAGSRVMELEQTMRSIIGEDMRAYLGRATFSENGFRERLVAFWADHFTVSGREPSIMLAVGAYLDEAIRPAIAGKFADMLRAVVTHPAMLLYLDQNTSIGPGSPQGLNTGQGLNENLAREVLELHTLGVSGTYSQTDVRQLAELFTGLSIDENGFVYNAHAAEPGSEQILGKTYGSNNPVLSDIFAFLDDLALNPQTASHIASKLAVHFISENPPAELVAGMAETYQSSGGDLFEVYQTLLDHPASMKPPGAKAKWPTEYVVSSLRALDLGEELLNASLDDLQGLHTSLLAMGQDLFRASGPDGLSEAAADWITPPTLAARIEWAGLLANEFGQDLDPRPLLDETLGEVASPELRFAVAEAESRWEGVALMLVSPEFNRR
ncbi:MAG TPA: DUF1800 domain-containing protein [Devosia sp.]|nr:DUF1800 domain-containing protein [Devosia sp.]